MTGKFDWELKYFMDQLLYTMWLMVTVAPRLSGTILRFNRNNLVRFLTKMSNIPVRNYESIVFHEGINYA